MIGSSIGEVLADLWEGLLSDPSSGSEPLDHEQFSDGPRIIPLRPNDN